MKYKLVLSIVIFIVVITVFTTTNFTEKSIDVELNSSELTDWMDVGLFKFRADPNEIIMQDGTPVPLRVYWELRSELKSTYEKIKKSDNEKSAFIVPIFTASAYGKDGFYFFYNKLCDDRCLTTKIISSDKYDTNSSDNARQILKLLGYEMITDVDVDQDPKILQKYDKIILLHNEYVTKSMFNAIMDHPKIIYLYPNSLYGEISTDYDLNTISLIRGHAYPTSDITNGFDWEFDNTPMEYDTDCLKWEFYEITNGIMLNCYPEQLIWKDERLLKIIKEF